MKTPNNRELGMFRAAACVPSVKPGDVNYNVDRIIDLLSEVAKDNPDIVVFPELSISGYTCADLFHDSLLQQAVIEGALRLAEISRNYCCAIVVGAPIACDNKLYNCALMISGGKINGIVPKTYLPNYNEFYEERWFCSSLELPENSVVTVGNNIIPIRTEVLFDIKGTKVGIEICEDLWVPEPPSGKLCKAGADVMVNLSASDELIGKHRYLRELIGNQSARCRCGYVYASAGSRESSTDLAFTGISIIAEDGRILSEGPRFDMKPSYTVADIDISNLRHDRIHFKTFSTGFKNEKYIVIPADIKESCAGEPLAFRYVDSHPFVDDDEAMMNRRCDEISSIQAWGLATRLKAINCKKAVIGISGGLDSTLALMVTVKAFDMLDLDRKGIVGITMPGFGTTARTKDNATRLMEILGITHREISIAKAVEQHFSDIGHNPKIQDVTYENSQARERTHILMDIANQENGIVIGTGDLSELALGWCTYNGDQMSMYGVNASVPKTMVRYLVSGHARLSDSTELSKTLLDIVDTPISPELLPAAPDGEIKQITEDVVGPYELHDFFLYQMMRYGMDPVKIYFMAVKGFEGKYDKDTISKWLKTFYKRFFGQQFKRSCMPDGIKVGSICLSPRGDWRMPSDASVMLWQDRLKEIE